ncbi:MAG: hypothetical protein EPO24_11490 [Bacteroidetes bacterium]|nr:MAG: hypothetical protein EPO24_11490 [Bacteroidota bacterium]
MKLFLRVVFDCHSEVKQWQTIIIHVMTTYVQAITLPLPIPPTFIGFSGIRFALPYCVGKGWGWVK